MNIVGVPVTEADVLTDPRERHGSLSLCCCRGLEARFMGVGEARRVEGRWGRREKRKLAGLHAPCTKYAIAHLAHPFSPCN